MRSKLLDESNGKRTYMLVFAIGDEVSRGLLDFAAEKVIQNSTRT